MKLRNILLLNFVVKAYAITVGLHRSIDHPRDLSTPRLAAADWIPECVHSILGKYNPPEADQKLPGIDAVFVIHYPPSGRGAQLHQSLSAGNLTEAATIVDFLNKEDVAKMSEEELQCIFDPKYLQAAFEGQKAVSIKHLWVRYRILQKGYQNTIIMEDDPWFGKHAAERLWTLSDEVAKLGSYYSVMLAGCYGLHPRLVKDKQCGSMQVTDHMWGPGYKTRCANGYLLSHDAAEALLKKSFLTNHPQETQLRIDDNADTYMDSVLMEKNYWYEPPIWMMQREDTLMAEKSLSKIRPSNPCVRQKITVRGKDSEAPSDE